MADLRTQRHSPTLSTCQPSNVSIKSLINFQSIQFKSPPYSPLHAQIPSQTQSWQKSEAMAPSKNNSHSSSSNRHGENVGRPNILASAYCVDSSARLTGFHYSTTGAGGTYPRPHLHSIEPSYPAPQLTPITHTDILLGAQWFP